MGWRHGKPVAIIKTAGHGRPGGLVVLDHGSDCGDIRNGISVAFEHERGGFVIDWDSFEKAYLALNATRAQAVAAYEDAKRRGRP